jgi:hypothetical protein
LANMRSKILAVGIVWGLLAGREGLSPGHPLAWPKEIGKSIFHSLGLPAFPPIYFFLLGLTLWSGLFFLIGVVLEHLSLRPAVRKRPRHVRLKGGNST